MVYWEDGGHGSWGTSIIFPQKKHLDGNTAEYTRFEDNFFGLPSKRYSSSIGLQISNNLEAKVKDKDSLATEPKKVTILNNLNISTNYNLASKKI